MSPGSLPRLRLQATACPRRALILTDTPRPDCPQCEGDGGTAYDYGDHETGEYAGTDWDPCPCWDETRRWTLLPLPRFPRLLRIRRRTEPADPWATNGGYSNEPPF